jgi:hypothetical protein
MYHGYRARPRVMQPLPVAVAVALAVVWAVEGQVRCVMHGKFLNVAGTAHAVQCAAVHWSHFCVVTVARLQVPLAVEVPRGDHGGPSLRPRHTLQAHITIMKGAIARNRRAPLSGCRYY